jgi:hypothetical protein
LYGVSPAAAGEVVAHEITEAYTNAVTGRNLPFCHAEANRYFGGAHGFVRAPGFLEMNITNIGQSFEIHFAPGGLFWGIGNFFSIIQLGAPYQPQHPWEQIF